MGEKEEEDTAGGGEEEKEGRALEEEEQEEVATEELVEKGTVALSETTTHWLLSVAGTCVEEGDEKAGDSSTPFAGVDPRSGQSVCTLPLSEWKWMNISFQLVVENASLDLEDRSTQTLDLPR